VTKAPLLVQSSYGVLPTGDNGGVSQRIEKWRRWMDGPIKASVITMNHHRQLWRGLADVIENNGSLPPSAWWQHHFDIYAETQAMAVRRQADLHPDVASLGKLLSEVSEDAKQLTPEWWIGLWDIEAGNTVEEAFARRQWDDEFGGEVGVHLDPAIPAADLERLVKGSEVVRKHVDKHIAHSEDPGPQPKDPGSTQPETTLTLSDVHDAIDVIGEVFTRYYPLLEAASMVMLEPQIQHDWLAPFRLPWIRSDE
jgi:hypothetical protein